MKRIAIPVLCALLNMGAGMSPEVASDADGEADEIDFVEYTRRDSPARNDPLVRTAALTGERIDRAWLHREGNSVTAAVIMRQPEFSSTAVELLLEAPLQGNTQVARVLLAKALDAVKQTSAVKVTIHSPGLPEAAVRQVLDETGMIFSRSRTVEGVPSIDAYPDLYRRTPST